MIGGVFSLIGLAKDLAQYKSSVKAEHFDRFIQPMWELFCEIHEDYKRSFSEYRDLVDGGSASVDELIDRILRDMTYTENLRGDLRNMMEYYPYGNSYTNPSSVDLFVRSIFKYFLSQRRPGKFMEGGKNGVKWGFGFLRNGGRWGLIIDLKRRSVESVGADSMIDTALKFLQEDYKDVSEAYNILRKELLA